jgi:hypothetical protein
MLITQTKIPLPWYLIGIYGAMLIIMETASVVSRWLNTKN